MSFGCHTAIASDFTEKLPKIQFFDQKIIKKSWKIDFFGFFQNFPGGPPGNRKIAFFWSASTYPKNRVFFKKLPRKRGFRAFLAQNRFFTYFFNFWPKNDEKSMKFLCHNPAPTTSWFLNMFDDLCGCAMKWVWVTPKRRVYARFWPKNRHGLPSKSAV